MLFQIIVLLWWRLVVLVRGVVLSNLKMWLKVKGFVEKIQQWWNGYHFIVSASFIATKKLKALKEDLKKWNKEFGDLAFRNKSLSTELMGLDAREES